MKCLAERFENASIPLPKALLCSLYVRMLTGLCKLSTVGLFSQRRNGLHRLGTQPTLVAEAYLWCLPTGAPDSLARTPRCWPAQAHTANHACSSLHPSPLSLPPVSSLSMRWHCQSVLSFLMIKVPHQGGDIGNTPCQGWLGWEPGTALPLCPCADFEAGAGCRLTR